MWGPKRLKKGSLGVGHPQEHQHSGDLSNRPSLKRANMHHSPWCSGSSLWGQYFYLEGQYLHLLSSWGHTTSLPIPLLKMLTTTKIQTDPKGTAASSGNAKKHVINTLKEQSFSQLGIHEPKLLSSPLFYKDTIWDFSWSLVEFEICQI